MVAEGEERSSNKLLVGILSGLILVIVGLVIGIVVVNNTPKGEDAEFNPVLPEELTGDDLSPIDQVTKETSIMLQDPNINDTDIEEYYDEAINDAIVEGNSGLSIEIIIQKMNFLAIIEDDCAKAKEYINNVDLSFYTTTEKQYLASYVISVAGECNDEDLRYWWENLLGEWSED